MTENQTRTKQQLEQITQRMAQSIEGAGENQMVTFMGLADMMGVLLDLGERMSAIEAKLNEQ